MLAVSPGTRLGVHRLRTTVHTVKPDSVTEPPGTRH